MIKVSSPPSILDSILDFLRMKPDKPEATFNITKFGSFTANFKALPPPIPAEYLATLFTVVVTAFIGSWLTPTVIGWRKAKADARTLNYYHKKISPLYDNSELDENDIAALNQLRSNILDTYAKGKISEKHYESLKNEISILYEKIFRKRINSLNHFSDKETKEEQLDKIKNEVESAYSEGKLSELHYNLINKNILNLEGKDDKI